MVGTSISHYKVTEKIGEGGMGEVYRATDTKLNRDVALKILPEQFASNSQRMGRFQREAEVLASLDHPNIGQIYGIEEAGATKALVLQLIEGPTLAERIAQGAIPVEEALKIALQIAEGLEAAHEKGMIHRDLKPANIKITPEGQVKILDFGLAKALEGETPDSSLSQSPTLTNAATQAGVILGTAAYMSPEQAKGKAVDKRADIFAFGAVLYELLTGKRAFEGETITETIAAVLKSEPAWEKLPSDIPWRIKELLGDCLQKEAHDRLHDIANVRIQIKKALTEPATESPIGLGRVAQPPLWKRVIPWSMTVVAVAVAAGAVWSLTRPVSRPITRFLITPEATAPLGSGTGKDMALSPDGSSIVYLSFSQGERRLYVRRLDENTARPLAGTEGSYSQPFFSPDGESVGFFTDNQMKRVSLSGGGAISICNIALGGVSATWGPNDMIVFSDASFSLYRVSAAGGEPQVLASPNSEKGEIYYRHPEILPGGEAMLFTVWGNEAFQTRVLSLETGDQNIVVEGGRQAHYLPTGYLVYERAGNLMAAPFDVERLEISGNAVSVLEGVRQQNFAADYALSTNGTLVYVSGMEEQWSLVWVDRDGTRQSLMESEAGLEQQRLSPDGKRVVFKSAGAGDIMRGVGDIWIYDVSRGTATPLTFDGFNTSPIWTLDGKHITFGRGVGIFDIPADGSGEASQLTTTTADTRYLPGSWSPDGVLAYSEGTLGNQDIYVFTLEGKGIVAPFMVTEFDEKHPVFSPDGKWVAFTSDRSGQYEVYVKPYPGEGGIIPISIGGGNQPVWASSGKELFYRSGRKMMVVAIETQPAFKAETPRLLFEDSYQGVWFGLTSGYDVTPDGKRFVMVQSNALSDSQTQINVVLNWVEELKRLVPTN